MAQRAKRIVSVVTADIIHSTRYDSNSRRRINTILKRSFADLIRKYPNSIHTRLAFRITAGDEFQFVVTNVPQSFDLLTYLRASVAMSNKIRPTITFRAAIGVGGITLSRGSNSYEKDGEAFVRARKGLEELDRRRQRLTKIVTGNPDTDPIGDLTLLFMDRLQNSWTVPQWEAVKWSLLGFKREEIAGKLKVAHQNVTKRLTAAGWQEFLAGSQFLRELLEKASNPN